MCILGIIEDTYERGRVPAPRSSQYNRRGEEHEKLSNQVDLNVFPGRRRLVRTKFRVVNFLSGGGWGGS